jgi:hypothetical protein
LRLLVGGRIAANMETFVGQNKSPLARQKSATD